MIDILVPVLSRPQNAAPLVNSIEASTKIPHIILFLCSPGDIEQIEACRKTEAEMHIVPWAVGRSDYPKKMNYGFRATKGQYVLMGADDLAFQENWDIIALAAAEETGVGVIGTNDCSNAHVKKGYFSTHPLVRRTYAEESGASLDGPGTLVSESYDHNYCDRELCHLAQARSQWAFAADSRLQHQHPLWRTAQEDSTYVKGRESWREDLELFFERSAQWGHIGLTLQERHYYNRTKRRRDKIRRMKVRA